MCNSRLLRASNLCEHQTKAVFGLKQMVGGGEHKVVLDEGGFRVYYVEVDQVLMVGGGDPKWYLLCVGLGCTMSKWIGV